MPLDDPTLSKLLQMKRFEQPPAGYFEDFLKEFQYRQRAQLLRTPAWRLAWERFQALLQEHLTLSHFTYATASLAVLCLAGALTLNMLEHPGSGVRTSAAILAANTAASVQGVQSVQPVQPAGSLQMTSAPAPQELTLTPQIRIPEALLGQVVQTGGTRTPRYVLDARPVSYEPPFSF